MNLTANQKTSIPEEKHLKKKWFLMDVKGKLLGDVATKIANLLRGKDKPLFTPQIDCGDYVVVINAKHIKLTGKKMDDKMYYWHTQYPGGIKSRTARQLLDTKPEKVLTDAVYGMLPRNKTRKHLMRKFHVFPEATHTLIAQNPQIIEL
ncbi:MAG: 50S ribosomal protein L13 [Candidatus Gracilibacteria bacterium]